jgi:lysophospholipase L1-like esterase
MRASLRTLAAITAALALIALAGAARGEQARSGPTLHNSAVVLSTDPVLELALVGDSTMASLNTALDAVLTQGGVAHHITNLAVVGATCADWAAPGALSAAVALHADVYLVNCGTNDAKFASTLSAIRANLHAIYTTLLSGTAGARVLPHYIQYNAGWTGRQDSEGRINDGVYEETTGATPAGLVTPAVTLGFIPETLLADGGHNGAAGNALVANYEYRALRIVYGWPDVAPIPCGQDGHRIGDPPYAQGTYRPFNGPAPCWAGWAVLS